MPSDPIQRGPNGSERPPNQSSAPGEHPAPMTGPRLPAQPGPVSSEPPGAAGASLGNGSPTGVATGVDGAADDGAADHGEPEHRAAEHRSTEQSATEQGTTEQGATEQGATEQRTRGQRARGQRASDEGTSEHRTTDRATAGRRDGGGAPSRRRSRGVARLLFAVGATWQATFVVGCASVVLGALVVAWPAVTVRAAAILLAAQILVCALHSLAQAVVEDRREVGRRTLLVLLGVVGLAVGIPLLRDHTPPSESLVLLVGLFWTMSGVITLVAAFFEGDRPARGVRVVTSALSLVAGVLVLAYPRPSWSVLTVVFSAWLVAFGVLTGIAAIQTRAAGRSQRHGARLG